MGKELTVCCETSQEVCAAETASHERLSEAELSEVIRGKILKYLSSGRVLALAIIFTAGAVMYSFAGSSMLLLLALAFSFSGDMVGFNLATTLLTGFSYIVTVVIYALAAAALFKIRASARRGEGCDAVKRLLSLRKCISAFRVFYYISLALSAAVLPLTMYSAERTSADVAALQSEAYLVGYIIVIVFAVLYMVIGAVWNHICCSSIIKLTDSIRYRYADPLSEKPKKCTLAAVLNFINAGVLTAVVGLIIAGLVFSVIILFVGAPYTVNSATEPTWMIAGVIIAVAVAVIYFMYAAVLLVVSAPTVTYYILTAVAALKYNKLEKEIAALIADNSEDSARSEQITTV